MGDDEALEAALRLSRQAFDELPVLDVVLRASLGLSVGSGGCLAWSWAHPVEACYEP